ncbi:MAG: diguanylate cyclase [Longimicrobiales bacterium]
MFSPDPKGPGGVPSWALTLSFAALMVPIIGDLALPRGTLGPFQALIWLIALIPALLLAYYRGWKGVAAAVAAGIVTLALYQALVTGIGLPVPAYFPGMVVAFLGLALGIGWLGERLHLDRAQVEALALTDLLTHLPNRRHARVFLENEFAAAGRGRQLTVVLFDLDSFKAYNDRYGHQAGDEALTIFAGILAQNTRRMNLSSRFGGEEFLSVLAGTDVEGALVFAERVRATLRTVKLPRGALTVSAGVASFHKTMRSPEELLAAADHALYQAKREGRNRVRLFSRILLEEAVPGGRASRFEEEATRDGDSRGSEERGRTRSPVTLLPHQVTGFGVDRRILLVEDEEAVRDMLTSYLRKEGFEVTAAPEVTFAIEHLGTEFDAVITDLNLPGRWGTELVAAVKARWPGTHVLVTSGIQDARLLEEAINAGADSFLNKPFEMADLRTTLQEGLAHRNHSLGRVSDGRVVSAEARVRSDAAKRHLLEGTHSLVAAVEVRDPCTQGHHQRVTRYAQVILQALDPGGESPSPLSLALGTEHLDIGMIGVPDHVLFKAEPLTQEETEFVKEHPEVGRRILSPMISDEAALEVVTSHHERWDGTGYPHGLAGEAIPISARIAAVADTLDALTSCRAHRKGLEWEEAVSEILSESGTQFDPEIVAAFRTSLPRLREIWEELADRVPGGRGTSTR